MTELYTYLGFNKHPFMNFSAEEETEYLNQIYEVPTYYQSLLTEIVEGNSRYLFGERGAGKSALMFYIMGESKQRGAYPVLIDRYDGIPIKNNGVELLLSIEKTIINKMSVDMFKDCRKTRRKIKGLSKHEKDILSYVLVNYFDPLSKSEYERIVISSRQNTVTTLLRKVYNSILVRILNGILSGVTDVAGETIRKALGLPKIDNDIVRHEFFEPIKYENIEKEKGVKGYREAKITLTETAKLIKSLGLGKLVIFLDKIDEFQDLESDIKTISVFLKQITTDTSLLYDDSFGLIFVLWSKIKSELSENGVRFDKTRPIDVNWNSIQLEKMINKRLTYFSSGKIDSIDMIVSDSLKNDLLAIADRSPRQIISLLATIYDEQSRISCEVKKISDEAVKRGENRFCQEFNYEMLNSGKGKQIVSLVNKLIKVGKLEFTVKDLATENKVSSQSGNNWVGNMKNFGLIEEVLNGSGAAKHYKITDPKVSHMIINNLEYTG